MVKDPSALKKIKKRFWGQFFDVLAAPIKSGLCILWADAESVRVDQFRGADRLAP